MLEVLKQALEALYPISHNSTDDYRGQADKAIASLRQAIAELESQDGACQHCAGKGCVACDAREQEPDKYEMDIECTKCGAKQSGVLTVHTHPPQRTWQKLTDEEMRQVCYEIFSYDPYAIARVIEAKLKEKNT